eukprot:380189_1
MSALISNVCNSVWPVQQQSKRFVSENVIKRGWFHLQSRYFNIWHKAYVVLTVDTLFIFNNKQDNDAVEIINIDFQFGAVIYIVNVIHYIKQLGTLPLKTA